MLVAVCMNLAVNVWTSVAATTYRRWSARGVVWFQDMPRRFSAGTLRYKRVVSQTPGRLAATAHRRS